MPNAEKRDALQVVTENHPHMGSLAKMMALDARIYASNWAVWILSCKTTGEVKKTLQWLCQDGLKAEEEAVAYQQEMKTPSFESINHMKDTKKRRKK